MAKPTMGTASDARSRGASPGAEAPLPLAEAKLAVPGVRAGMVDRPRIRQALEGSGDTRLTLVAAPAGYGKTTAVRGWCESRGDALAWVTLDDARQRSGSAVDVRRHRRRSGAAGARARRAPAARRLGQPGRGGRRRAHERRGRVREPDRHRARRPSRRDRARMPGVDRPCARAPPGERPHGREHARGSRVAARAAARRRRARGGARERPRVHPRGGHECSSSSAVTSSSARRSSSCWSSAPRGGRPRWFSRGSGFGPSRTRIAPCGTSGEISASSRTT